MKINILYVKADVTLNFEIEVSEFDRVMDIKKIIDKHLGNHDMSKFFNYLINFKNIILNDNNFIRFYKIITDDKIYIGKPEHILKDDEIILDVLLVTKVQQLIHLIIEKRSTISEIKLIIDRIHPCSDNAHLWNCRGYPLLDEAILIDTGDDGAYQRMIFSDDNRSFGDCCLIHDRYLMDLYFWQYAWRFWEERDNDSVMDHEMRVQLNEFWARMLAITTNDARLAHYLKDVPDAFRQSGFLFCQALADGIFAIFRDNLKLDWQLHQDYYCRVPLGLFQYALLVTLRVAILHCLSENSFSAGNADTAMKLVAQTVIRYFADPAKIEQDFVELFSRFFLLAPLSGRQQITDSGAWSESHGAIRLRKRGCRFAWMKLPKFIQTVFQAKEAISSQICVLPEDLFLIRCDGDYKPHDDDKYEINKTNFDIFMFEIVCSTAGIEKTVLGQGASGVVFLCRDMNSMDEFALKKPKQEMLYKNISNHARLSGSPGIVSFKGLYNDEGVICIAMEYLPQGTLTSYIEKRKFLTEKEIAEICYQLLPQIKELHRNGFIHRDIKCGNIVFDEQFNAKLIDYDSSECHTGSPVDKIIPSGNDDPPGTLYYMAPEVMHGEPYSNKIDIWSFGVSVMEMITGARPYANLGMPQTIFKILETREIILDPQFSISPELQNFLDCCLKKSDDERYSAEQLLQSKFIQDHIQSQNP